ncbi:unnamed protein product [Tilletia controversa]|uniref:triacylglycerol lipase n=3 Tax=Tilletia TaxID=13289 RepID=A0A8X7T0T0_9BASI|nr:hypothetical protein CF336_g2830 [Tilletia laevis]KAE8205417.1 hypothetical protein CF328_g509 [Tilletia controversa]KAE8262951.1 hypothetical protein A4X03_0g2046 [Tilletia caries]KAE8206341.1 hypothetical protein CF335_g1967 [Tilletia laevis]KAE8255698.1 hypothetical protein A4X06_0g305 [Tilletia controversa]
MKLTATFTTLLAVLVASATAAPHPDLLVATLQPRLLFPSSGASADVPDPTADAFYKPPAGFESKANGAVLRSRNMTTYKIKNSAGAFQILYKTIDAEGNADASVVTFVVPQAPVSPARLVSITQPEDAAAPICAPSYQIRKSSGDGTGLEAYLAKGYWGVVPDHEGSKSAAFVGPTEGPATLDAIRAAIKFQKLNVKTTQIGLTGYSGGAHAAAWAAQLSKTHAPELKIVAAAVGGVPVNPKNLLLNLTKGLFSGLAAVGVVGEYNAYSDLRAFLDKYLTPKGRDLVQKGRTNVCLAQAVTQYAFLDILPLINRTDPLNESPIRERLAQNLLGGDGSISPIPTYIYHGRDDDIVSRPDADAYVKQQCAGGARFTYVVDAGQNHITEAGKRATDAQNWIIGRLNGSIPVPAAC